MTQRIKPAGGFGGGGSGTIVIQQIFPTNVERDSYYAAHPDQLRDGIYIYITSTSMLQQYDMITHTWFNRTPAIIGQSGYSGYSGMAGAYSASGYSGYSGYSGVGISGYSGISGYQGTSGYSGQSSQAFGPNGYIQYTQNNQFFGTERFTWDNSTSTFAIIGKGIISESLVVGEATESETSLVQLNSTTKGFRLPRMTTPQRLAILNPDEGLQVYDLTTHTIHVYDGEEWLDDAAGMALITTRDFISLTSDQTSNIEAYDSTSIVYNHIEFNHRVGDAFVVLSRGAGQENGIISLPAHRRYNIRASVAITQSDALSWMKLQWWNRTEDSPLEGSNVAYVVGIDYGANVSAQPMAEAIINTQEACDIELRIIAVSVYPPQSIIAETSYCVIETLP
jgi:hypothetical protein